VGVGAAGPVHADKHVLPRFLPQPPDSELDDSAAIALPQQTEAFGMVALVQISRTASISESEGPGTSVVQTKVGKPRFSEEPDLRFLTEFC
jgi:hypothetical protein